jgi:hypothetical protein
MALGNYAVIFNGPAIAQRLTGLEPPASVPAGPRLLASAPRPRRLTRSGRGAVPAIRIVVVRVVRPGLRVVVLGAAGGHDIDRRCRPVARHALPAVRIGLGEFGLGVPLGLAPGVEVDRAEFGRCWGWGRRGGCRRDRRRRDRRSAPRRRLGGSGRSSARGRRAGGGAARLRRTRPSRAVRGCRPRALACLLSGRTGPGA